MKVPRISTEISKKNSPWPLEQLGTALMGNKLSHLGHFPFTELRPGSVILTLRVEPESCWWLFIFCHKGGHFTPHTSHLVTISCRHLCLTNNPVTSESVSQRVSPFQNILTSVPNHFEAWFDSSKTRGKLAPTLPGVSGGLGVSFNYRSQWYQKKYFLRGFTKSIGEDLETISHYLIRKLQK